MTEPVGIEGGPTLLQFRHAVLGQRALDAFNGVAAMPVTFHASGQNTPQVAIQGNQSPRFSTWLTESPSGFLSRPKLTIDLFTLRFVTAGAMIRRGLFRDHVGRPGYAMLLPFEGMRNEEATAGFSSISGTISREILTRCHEALHGEEAGPLPQFEPVAEMDRPAMQALRHTFRSLLERLRADVGAADLVLPLLEEVTAYQLLSAWPQAAARRPASRPAGRLVRMAADYVEANIARRITLAEVAGATGMSVRSLQAAFRQTTGRTPVQYMTERRLEAARDDLRRAGPQEPIAAVAERWGFHHMGEFSRRYRLRYGESPRDTRQRAKP